MRYCLTCNAEIKNRTTIKGKVVNTQRRKHCYKCSPFGSGNNQLVKGNKTVEQVAEVIENRKAKRKEIDKQQYALYQKEMRHDRKRKLIEAFGGACIRCGYNRCLWALEFHHIEKGVKSFSLSLLGYTCSWDRLIEEASKCELLCSNCHREKEYEERYGGVAQPGRALG